MLIRLKYATVAPLYKEALQKRYDELRHYMHLFIDYDSSTEDKAKEHKSQLQRQDHLFYK